MNILSAFTALKEKLDGFLADQKTATVAALAEFSTTLTNLKTGAVAQVESLTAQLGKAQADLSASGTALQSAQAQFGAVDAALTSALADLKVTVTGAPLALEKVALLKSAVSTTLAKLNVPAGNIPAPAASSTATAAAGSGKTKSAADFAALPPHDKMAFMRAGGKITD